MAFSVRNIVFLALIAAMMLVTVQAQSCYRQCQKEGLPNCDVECRDTNCYRMCMKQIGDYSYCNRSCHPIRYGSRRHHMRAPLWIQQPRVASGTPTTLSRRPYATTTAQSDQALWESLSSRRRRPLPNFTPEQDAMILEMRLEGAPWKEIGEALKIDGSICHQRYMKVLDPQLRVGWSEESMAKLNSMVAKRVPWNQIAIQLNVAPHACREKWLEINREALLKEKMAKMEERRLARKKRIQDAIANGERRELVRQRWTPSLDALLVEWHNRGWTWRQIGRAFGIVPMACFNRYLTLKERIQSGGTLPALDEEALPYFLRKDSKARDPHAAFRAISPIDPSGQFTSRWYAMHQMTKILTGEYDATQQTTDSPAHPNTFTQAALDSLTISEVFPINGRSSFESDPHTWSELEDETIRRMHKDGHTFQSIASVLGLKIRQVLARYYTVLDTSAEREWTPETLDKLDFYVRQGLSWATIGSNLGKKTAVCKLMWQELQRASRPLSANSEENSADRQPHLSGQESQSSPTPSAQPPPQGAAPSTASPGPLVDKREQPSSQEQTRGSQHDTWGAETVAASDKAHDYDGVDHVDEYDIDDDQDDHPENHEDDAYFENDQDGEDDSRLMIDHERDVPGSSSKRQKSSTRAQPKKSSPSSKSKQSLHSLPLDYWDQNAVLRAIAKHWTVDEETALIQHVLKHGPRDWDRISRKIIAGRSTRAREQPDLSSTVGDENTDPITGIEVLQHEHFSPEECQAYWKHLDLPVRRQRPETPDGGGSVRWTFESDRRRMAHFWQLWLELGPDYDLIASRLSSETGGQDDSLMTAEDVVHVTPAQCRQYFEERTQSLRQFASARDKATDESNTSVQSEDGTADEGESHDPYIKLAKSLAVVPKFQWTKERSVILQKLVRQRLRTRGVQINWVNWKWVARHVGGGVAPSACSNHWRTLRQVAASTVQQDKSSDSEKPRSSTDAPWTEQDVLLLEQGIRDVGVDNNAINGSTMFLRTLQRFYLPHHSLVAIQRKYFTLSDKATEVTLDEYLAIMEAVDDVTKQTLTDSTAADKDDTATEMVQDIYSPTSELWDKVIQRMNKKHKVSGWTKAPTRRIFESSYQHYLRVKAPTWTKDEDQDLVQIVKWLGREDWLSIARFFPERSAWECRLRWCSLTDEVNLSKTPSNTAL
ncbi:hypothetical protein BGZ73_005919 [Actinomortierella ambigua]|nr:hypothetical protein BGZ73_005919 [Actinomortierella ambigua]